MEEVKQDSETILLFEDAEELKWYFHKKLCEGDDTAEFMMNRVVNEKLYPTIEDLNRWLETFSEEKLRVKEK